MYRAIPEVNRICAMQDRSRRYRIHQEALKKINRAPSQQALSRSQLNNRSPSPKNYSRKCNREEMYRINNENNKMKNAIASQSSALNRKDFNDLDLEHKKQVARLLQNDYSYGFNNKRRTAQSKLSSIPSLKKSEDENFPPNNNYLYNNDESSKPSFIRENPDLFQLDFSKVVNENL